MCSQNRAPEDPEKDLADSGAGGEAKGQTFCQGIEMHERCPGRLRGGRFWCLRPLAEALMRVRGVTRAQIPEHDGEAGGGDCHAGEGGGGDHEADELPGHLTSALAGPGGLPASCSACS